MQRRFEVRGKNDWLQLLAGLNETKIQWQPSWQQRSRLICHYGKYPNVPLVGIKCFINYNMVLAQRQFGYPIKGSRTYATLAPLLFYYEDGFATEILHKIRNA